jgi:hypothetical protein
MDLRNSSFVGEKTRLSSFQAQPMSKIGSVPPVSSNFPFYEAIAVSIFLLLLQDREGSTHHFLILVSKELILELVLWDE